jgi:adenosine deaminase
MSCLRWEIFFKIFFIFTERHDEFEFVVRNLNNIFDQLKEKGTGDVTLGQLREFIKSTR